MGTNKHRMRFVFGFAIIGMTFVVLTHLAGGENGTQGGYVEHPVLRLVSLLAWGGLGGGVLGWLAGASPHRATIPIGLGFLLAIVGFVAGTVVGVNLLGEALIDGNASRLLTSALVGSGVGWSVGAGVGLSLARRAHQPTRTKSWMLRVVGLAVLLVGVVTARFETSLAGPGGLRARYLTSVQVMTVVDAALVGLTLLIVAGWVRATPSPTPTEIEGTFVRQLGKAGLFIGCIASIAVFVVALQSEAAVATGIQRGLNARTADTLAARAADYQDRKGAYPADLHTLLASGGEVADGSFVNFAGVVPGGFCVKVGTDIGGSYGGPPFYSAVVHPRPPKAKSWLAAEGWVGDSCSSRPQTRMSS